MDLIIFVINFIKEVLLKNKKLDPTSSKFDIYSFTIYTALALSLYFNYVSVIKIYDLGVKIFLLENKYKTLDGNCKK